VAESLHLQLWCWAAKRCHFQCPWPSPFAQQNPFQSRVIHVSYLGCFLVMDLTVRCNAFHMQLQDKLILLDQSRPTIFGYIIYLSFLPSTGFLSCEVSCTYRADADNLEWCFYLVSCNHIND
jgi:hypothetical protein